jgi:hypothetical protein
MVRYLLAWLPMVGIAVANGAFREGWLVPQFGERQGRQASTVLLVVLLVGYIAAVIRIWPAASSRHAAAIGGLWLVLTLAFEFSLGRFVSGLSWREMLAEYDLPSGRLWALVPLWIAVAPYLFYRLYDRRR